MTMQWKKSFQINAPTVQIKTVMSILEFWSFDLLRRSMLMMVQLAQQREALAKGRSAEMHMRNAGVQEMSQYILTFSHMLYDNTF